MLQISIGIIYLWFGGLKFFPHVSPAEGLASETIYHLTFGVFTHEQSLILLALWEVSIGMFLVIRRYFNVVFWAVLLHMICTFSPLILLPAVSFTAAPYGLTLVGQYIIKNIVIVSALIVIKRFPQSSPEKG